jgi:hypothetical protein
MRRGMKSYKVLMGKPKVRGPTRENLYMCWRVILKWISEKQYRSSMD